MRVPFSTGPVSALSLAPQAELLAAVCNHGEVHLTEPPSLPPDLQHIPPTKRVLSHPSVTAICLPSAEVLYVADAKGSLQRYDVSADTFTRVFDIPGAHPAVELTAVAALSPDSHLLTAGKDGLIRVWDPQTRQSLVKLKGHRYDVRALSLASSSAPDDSPVTIVASAGRDRTVRLWDVRMPATSSSLHVFHGHSGWVHDVALVDTPAPLAVSVSGDRTLRIWDLRSMRLRTVLAGHHYRIWSVDVAADARFAVSASTDATVRVWPLDLPSSSSDTPDPSSVDPVTDKELQILDSHRDSVLSVAARRDGRLVLSGCEDGSLMAWHPDAALPRDESENFLEAQSPKLPLPSAKAESERQAQTPPETNLIDFDDSPTIPASQLTVPKSLDDIPLIPDHVTETATTAEAALRAATKEGPEGDPRFDKSAAELVGALQRIRELEAEVRGMESRVAERDATIATMKAEAAKRNNEMSRLTKQLEVSRRSADALKVSELLRIQKRKTDVSMDYREPVNKIGAVTDQLTKLAAKLDAMIATP